MTPGLASYERVKKIAVLDRDFEIGADEVTPTLKVRRNIVERKYAGVIEPSIGNETGPMKTGAS